jgi:hypothetical protein
VTVVALVVVKVMVKVVTLVGDGIKDKGGGSHHRTWWWHQR